MHSQSQAFACGVCIWKDGENAVFITNICFHLYQQQQSGIQTSFILCIILHHAHLTFCVHPSKFLCASLLFSSSLSKIKYYFIMCFFNHVGQTIDYKCALTNAHLWNYFDDICSNNHSFVLAPRHRH